MSGLTEAKATGRQMARDIVHYLSDKKSAPTAINEHEKTLRRTVDILLEKHHNVFASMTKKLQIGEPGTGCDSITTIANKMFVDRHYNWGRVVTLYAFAGQLATYCVENNMDPSRVEEIGTITGNYVAENLCEWIVREGGWVCNDCLLDSYIIYL
jgi:Apoptosis regulator proteins, Bcl-2 family